jgi:hypothetical protein
MRSVRLLQFERFLSKNKHDDVVFNELDMTIKYWYGNQLLAKCKVSDEPKGELHHGIWCKEFEVKND